MTPFNHSRTPIHSFVCAALVVWLLLSSNGCRSPEGHQTTSPYEPMREVMRDTSKAQALTQRAAKLIDADDLEGAKEVLQEALAADLYHGPGHNNLGVVHLKLGELYEAANEFEWARKLMPGHPSPRMNLALTLENAGRTQEALATYQTVLEVYPEHIETIQAMARLQIRGYPEPTLEYSEDLVGLLSEIALRGTTKRWRDWARDHLQRQVEG